MAGLHFADCGRQAFGMWAGQILRRPDLRTAGRYASGRGDAGFGDPARRRDPDGIGTSQTVAEDFRVGDFA